jgi:nicotinamidase-related amidase
MRTTGQSSKLTHPGKSALILVEVQNDFLRRGAPTEIGRAHKLIPKLQMITNAMRTRGFPVVHVITHHHRSSSDLENPRIERAASLCGRD